MLSERDGAMSTAAKASFCVAVTTTASIIAYIHYSEDKAKEVYELSFHAVY